MKCLISGINGVVGKILAQILKDQYNWDVYGIGKGMCNQIKYFQVDLASERSAMLFSKKIDLQFDIFLHCAAKIDLNAEKSDLISNNIIGTINAAKIGMSIGVGRFINISSIPVIGKIINTPISEDHPCNPINFYHFTKLYAEKILKNYNLLNSNFKVVTLRIPSPVGRGMPQRSIFPILVHRSLSNFDLEITGNRRAKQSYLDIRDLAQAIVKAAHKNNIADLYNIGPISAFNRIDLATYIIKQTNSRSRIIDLTFESEGYSENWSIESLKAEQDFNYKPIYSLGDTISWVAQE